MCPAKLAQSPWEMCQQLNLRAQIFISFGYQGSLGTICRLHCLQSLCLLHGNEDYITEALEEEEATDYGDFIKWSHDAVCKKGAPQYLQTGQGLKAREHLLVAEMRGTIQPRLPRGQMPCQEVTASSEGRLREFGPQGLCLTGYVTAAILFDLLELQCFSL